MTIGFVLGNGTSRAAVPLKRLEKAGVVYGCNALYRNFTPAVLVATDAPIAKEIQETGYALKNKFYTRNPLPDLGALSVPPQYYGYSSGPIAAAIAATECSTVFLLGFDFGSVTPNKFNNIYANTPFYKKSTDSATPGDNWVKQLSKIAVDYSEVLFVRVVGDESKQHDFHHITNVNTLEIKSFYKLLNTL